MFGFLNLDKPAGITSRDLVNRVQRLVRPLKVGHAGTLDPLATGVLVVAIGRATRLVEYVQRQAKTYRGTFLLGRTSDTEDIEGNVVELDEAPQPTHEQIVAALPGFLGTLQQRPPAYSALKVAGRRAYDLARRDETVDLAPRAIEIHDLELVRYDYPQLELRIQCGSGTYVRSLGRDLAQSLDTGAVMSALVREAIGAFRLETAMAAGDLTADAIVAHLLPPTLAIADLPQAVVTAEEARRLSLGQTIVDRWNLGSPEVGILTADGQLLAIASPRSDGSLRASKGFAGD